MPSRVLPASSPSEAVITIPQLPKETSTKSISIPCRCCPWSTRREADENVVLPCSKLCTSAIALCPSGVRKYHISQRQASLTHRLWVLSGSRLEVQGTSSLAIRRPNFAQCVCGKSGGCLRPLEAPTGESQHRPPERAKACPPYCHLFSQEDFSSCYWALAETKHLTRR